MIEFINTVINIINTDQSVEKFMKVIFVPNFTVALCEKFVSAADLSQHISTPGTEVRPTFIYLILAIWNIKYEIHDEWRAYSWE